MNIQNSDLRNNFIDEWLEDEQTGSYSIQMRVKKMRMTQKEVLELWDELKEKIQKQPWSMDQKDKSKAPKKWMPKIFV